MADSGNQRADAIVAPVCFACHPLSPVPGQLYGTGIGLKRRPRAFKLSLSRVSLRPYIDCNPIPLLSTSSAYPCCDAIACSAPLFYNPVHIQPYPLSQNSQCSSTTRVYIAFRAWFPSLHGDACLPPRPCVSRTTTRTMYSNFSLVLQKCYINEREIG